MNVFARSSALAALVLAAFGASGEGGRILAIHSPEKLLLAETTPSVGEQPAIAQEYVWFGGRPVAQFDSASTTARWTFADHLSTPSLQTGPVGDPAWRIEHEPFGAVAAVRAGAGLRQPLRFPGQEDQSFSDLTYNRQRWYRPDWGRYSQADPIGLSGSVNLFEYAHGRPTMRIDPDGLFSFDSSCAGFEATITTAWQQAQLDILRCRGIDCDMKNRVLDRLLYAHFECDPNLVNGKGTPLCGQTTLGGNTITIGSILKGGRCACMPALLAHEATHQFSFFNSEEQAESVENICWPACATKDPPRPPFRPWVGKIEYR